MTKLREFLTNVWAPFKNWFHARTDRTKAAIRTAWQSVLVATTVLVVTAVNEAADIVEGGTVEQSLADLSVAWKVYVAALLGVLGALVGSLTNRSGTRAHYTDPQ